MRDSQEAAQRQGLEFIALELLGQEARGDVDGAQPGTQSSVPGTYTQEGK